MKVTITIDCDNDAFGDDLDSCFAEIGRILKEAIGNTATCLDGWDRGVLRDSNGNQVGTGRGGRPAQGRKRR